MTLVRINFGAGGGPDQKDGMEAAAWSYLASLYKNGQISREYFVVWRQRRLTAYVIAARPNALALRYHSEWARNDYDSLIELSGQRPVRCFEEDLKRERLAPWRQSSSFFLASNALDVAFPLGCGDTGIPIPLYQLPISQVTRQDIAFWSSECAAHDAVFIASRDLEMPAYEQLADPGSGLSRVGRDLCATIEQATRKPTYYYVHRYWGRRDVEAENERSCPGCGAAWHTHRYGLKFHQFEFRCDACRLVSHSGDESDDRRARIGEFKR